LSGENVSGQTKEEGRMTGRTRDNAMIETDRTSVVGMKMTTGVEMAGPTRDIVTINLRGNILKAVGQGMKNEAIPVESLLLIEVRGQRGNRKGRVQRRNTRQKNTTVTRTATHTRMKDALIVNTRNASDHLVEKILAVPSVTMMTEVTPLNANLTKMSALLSEKNRAVPNVIMMTVSMTKVSILTMTSRMTMPAHVKRRRKRRRAPSMTTNITMKRAARRSDHLTKMTAPSGARRKKRRKAKSPIETVPERMTAPTRSAKRRAQKANILIEMRNILQTNKRRNLSLLNILTKSMPIDPSTSGKTNQLNRTAGIAVVGEVESTMIVGKLSPAVFPRLK